MACAVVGAKAEGKQVESKSSLGYVPASLTADGKARIVAFADDGQHIYNTDFVQEKVVTRAANKYTSGQREETATVTITGAKISFEFFHFSANVEDGTPFTPDGESTPLTASTIEEAKTKLEAAMGEDYTVKIYSIDGYSLLYCYYSYEYGNSASYFLPTLFGEKYPLGDSWSSSSGRSLYVFHNGMLYEPSTTSYSPIYDESEAVWTTVNDYTYENDVTAMTDVDYKDLDSGSGVEDWDIGFTQTLFNTDAKWEYAAVEYENYTLEIPSPLSSIGGVIDGKAQAKRYVNIVTPVKGLAIYSEDGSVVKHFDIGISNTAENYVYNIRFNSILKINGKKYLEIRKAFGNDYANTKYEIWSFDDDVNNVRKVAEYNGEAEPDNTIYDLNGRVLQEKPAQGIYIQNGRKYIRN